MGGSAGVPYIGIGIIMPIFFFILIFFFFIYIKCIKPMRAKSLSEMIKKNVVVRLDNGKIARVHDGKEITNGAFVINNHQVVRVIDGKVVKIHHTTPSQMTSEGIFTGVLIGTAPLGLGPICDELGLGEGTSSGLLLNGMAGNGDTTDLGNCGGHFDCNTDGGGFSTTDFGGCDIGGGDCSFAFGGGE